jgi:hypothetical protein
MDETVLRDFQRKFALLLCTFATLCWRTPLDAQVNPLPLRNGAGLQLLVADENSDPTLRIVLPGAPLTDRVIEVLFPEHVTVRKHGETQVEQLYLFRAGKHEPSQVWQEHDSFLQYEKDLKGEIHMLARATLESDGVLFDYEFTNNSKTAYDMIWAPLDPRLTSMFHDVRLERTYVHLKSGFDLLAAGTPTRLTMPLSEWLPARYKAQYTLPIPGNLVEHGSDGITYYYKAEPVDQPMLATLSKDGKWIVVTFSHTTGNVWSNPELTCQHVDEDRPLAPGQKTVLQVKLLVFRGTLDEALKKVVAQRPALQ